MKILFITESNLNLIGGDTIQFASSVNMYNLENEVYVLTNTKDQKQVKKLNFNSKVNFIFEENKEVYIDKIFELDMKYNFDFIYIRGSKLISKVCQKNSRLAKNKVIAYITDNNITEEEKLRLFNNVKLVRFQTNEYLEHYKKIGYSSDNYIIENPTIEEMNYDNTKRYDCVYSGKIAPGWEVSKFIELAIKNPNQKFCLIYSRIFNNLTLDESYTVEYGLNNLKNLDIFNNLSRKDTLTLVSKSKFGYCYRSAEIDNNNSLELSTKLLEYMSVGAIPIVRDIKMYRELLGENYPFLLDDISKFNNFTYDKAIAKHNKEQIQKYYPHNQYNSFINKLNPVKDFTYNAIKLSVIPSINELINILRENIIIIPQNENVKKFCTSKNLLMINEKKYLNYINIINIDKQKELDKIIPKFKEYNIFNKTLLIEKDEFDEETLFKIKNLGMEIYIDDEKRREKEFRYINLREIKIGVKELEMLRDISFSIKISTYKELLGLLNDAKNINTDVFNINIETPLDLSDWKFKDITVHKKKKENILIDGDEYINNMILLKIKEGIEIKRKRQYSNLAILNNIYPSNENLYAHYFVHTRVKLYNKFNEFPYVVVVNKSKINSYYYFDNQLVLVLNEKGIKDIFSQIANIKFAVHFINSYIKDILKDNFKDNSKTVWFHGADCLRAEHKKSFHDFSDEIQLREYKRRKSYMDLQFEMLKSLFKDSSYRYVFVSNWLKEKIENDLECKLERSYVIPNSINTEHFYYEKKNKEDKIKVLSIMPFLREHDQYANKVLVEAILLASARSWFRSVEFNIYGRGTGFDYHLNILRKFENVHIYETFLTHDEIKELHSESHIALFPNNQDTHGVSFYEAMSSGLVSISSNNSAKPEYCPNGEVGFLHKTQNVEDLVNILEYTIQNYENLDKVRKNGSDHVKEKFGEKKIIGKELDILRR